MPMYEYQCPNGHITEKMQPIADANRPVTCEHCPTIAERVLSPTPTSFRHNDRRAFKK